jgi:hypothetical protein
MPTSSQKPMQLIRPSIVSNESKYMNNFNIMRASIKRPPNQSVDENNSMSSIGDENIFDDDLFNNQINES